MIPIWTEESERNDWRRSTHEEQHHIRSREGRQIVMDMMAEAQALIAQGRGSGID
jgi:hypothetical protein